MNSGNLVSIVLPTHNGARYIEDALAGCRSQTYDNWELIVVDDASTDNTAGKVAAYAAEDARVSLVKHSSNRGLPGALNTGFSQTSGQYLTWTSDDNIYRPNALAEMVAFLDRRPEVDVVYTDYSVIDESGCLVGVVENPCPKELVRRCCVGACFLYRRRVQETLGAYDEALFCAEDYDFWLRASSQFHLEALHRDLYKYRYHSGTLTSTRRTQIMRATHLAQTRNLRRLPWLDGRGKTEAYLRLAEEDVVAGRRREGYLHFVEAVSYSPSHALFRDKGLVVRILLGRGAFEFAISARHWFRWIAAASDS